MCVITLGQNITLTGCCYLVSFSKWVNEIKWIKTIIVDNIKRLLMYNITLANQWHLFQLILKFVNTYEVSHNP